MPHDASGQVPPKPILPPVPHTFARRKGKSIPVELAIISDAVMNQGADINPEALSEETGLPADAIWRFAAAIAVNAGMVEAGQIDFEDSIRMGAKAEAASLRIVGKRYDSIEPRQPARTLNTADVMGMRRMDHRRQQDRRLVAAPRTLCPRCGGRADADGGCSHQRTLTTAETIAQGLPHA